MPRFDFAGSASERPVTIRVNVDGRPGGPEDPMLSPLDQGFLFGASVYETVRTYGGEPFLLARHLRRLRESATALAIELDVSDDVIAGRVRDTIAEAGNPESSVRIVVSAGVGSVDYRAGAADEPTVVVIVRPLPSYPESLYRDGTKAAFVTSVRAVPGNLSPKVKSSNLINNLMALRAAHERGAYEALLLNTRGEVTEGSMSNVFIVEKGVVLTPPLSAGILEGITRELVIEIAADEGVALEETTLLPDRLGRADEVFITASSRQVVPIVAVDDETIADGKPGPVTRKLMEAYQVKVRALMGGNRTES